MISASTAFAEVGGTITKTIESQPTFITAETPYQKSVNAIVTTFLQFFPWKDGDATITFTPTNLSASVGCNTLFGSYSIHGKTIIIGPLASTMMACEGGVMEKEQKLSHDLSQINSITFSNGKLVLKGDNTERLLNPDLSK